MQKAKKGFRFGDELFSQTEGMLHQTSVRDSSERGPRLNPNVLPADFRRTQRDVFAVIASSLLTDGGINKESNRLKAIISRIL